MNYAQGNTRSKPDGCLHVQNVTVTKAAGMAAVVYTHILDENQRTAVEWLLLSKAEAQEAMAESVGVPVSLYHVKHGTVRFAKGFLIENFREAVHTQTRFTRLPVIQHFTEKLIAERESLTY